MEAQAHRGSHPASVLGQDISGFRCMSFAPAVWHCSEYIASVDVSHGQACREFFWAYVSQTDNYCQKAKSQRIEKMLGRMAVLWLILYIRIKGGNVKKVCMKSTGGRLRRGRSKAGKPLGLHKKTKWTDTYPFALVSTGQFTRDICSAARCAGNQVTMRPAVCAWFRAVLWGAWEGGRSDRTPKAVPP